MAVIPLLANRLRFASRLLGSVVLLLGALAGLPIASSAWSSDARFPIPPPEGVAYLCAGLSLWIVAKERSTRRARLVSTLLSAATMAIAVATLGIQPRADPGTSVALLLTALGLVFVSSDRPAAVLTAHLLACAVFLLSLSALFGLVYRTKMLFGVTASTRMPLPAAMASTLMGIGIVLARPERGIMATVSSDDVVGFMARRLYPAVIGIPILLGCVTLLGEEQRLFNGKFGLSVLVLVTVVVFVLLIALTNRSLGRVDRSRMRLAAVLLEEAERRHIARELHDEVGQSLTALKINLETLGRSAPGLRITETKALVDDLMRRISNMSLELRPAMLDELGLIPALLWLFERYDKQAGIAVEFAHGGVEQRLSSALETAAFRIVQEGLSNAAKHSGARRINVRVLRRDDMLVINVQDDGKGFDAAAALDRGQTSGLLGMRERAVALDGLFDVDSAPGRGTCLTAEIPVVA